MKILFDKEVSMTKAIAIIKNQIVITRVWSFKDCMNGLVKKSLQYQMIFHDKNNFIIAENVLAGARSPQFRELQAGRCGE